MAKRHTVKTHFILSHFILSCIDDIACKSDKDREGAFVLHTVYTSPVTIRSELAVYDGHWIGSLGILECRGGSGIQKMVRPGSGCGQSVMCATSC